MLPGTGVSPDAVRLASDEPHKLPSGCRPQPSVPPSLSLSPLGSHRLYFGRDFLFDLENGKDCTPADPWAGLMVPRPKLPVAYSPSVSIANKSAMFQKLPS